MKKYLSYFILLVCVFVWCVLIVLPPFISLVESPSHEISNHLYKFFSPICHQYESHSLHLFGYKLGVCSRCLAIYAGFFMGILFYPLVSKKLNRFNLLLWIVAFAPMLLDVFLDIAGIHSCSIATRLFTGSFFGIISSLILTPTLIEAIFELTSSKNINQGVHHEFKT